MSEALKHSIFQQVFFPETGDLGESTPADDLVLRKVIRYHPDLNLSLKHAPLVIFDFETTGLDAGQDRIIEVGAVRLEHMKIVDEFSQLIQPEMSLSQEVINITGITDDMLAGMPLWTDVLPKFLKFFEGSILVAHNADFDMGFLRTSCLKEGYQLEWPAFCTLKMARQALPQLESKSLDALAEFYELEFEARHRSIGDVKVTTSVLESMLEQELADVETWQDAQPFAVTRS